MNDGSDRDKGQADTSTDLTCAAITSQKKKKKIDKKEMPGGNSDTHLLFSLFLLFSSLSTDVQWSRWHSSSHCRYGVCESTPLSAHS